METQTMKNLTILALAGASVLCAQGPGFRARPTQAPAAGKALQEQLQLTDQQMTQLRDVRKQQMEALRPQLQQLRTEAQKLRDLTQSANPDAAAVGKATLDVKNLREQIRAAREDSDKKARAILTPQQLEKLKDLEAALKLAAAARQAQALGLIDPPEGGMGAGPMGAGFGGQRARMGRRSIQ
jgi:Spy/CpxP family protein refolding chaperone